MQNKNTFLYACKTHIDADQAIRALSKAGLDLNNLSLIGRGYHSEQHPVGFYTAGNRIKFWGGIGAFWGGAWGFLLAPAVFFLPGLGLMAMAGPLVASLVGALEGAVVGGGLSAFAAALANIGVPQDVIIRYETALKADNYVLIVNGSDIDVEKARGVLSDHPQLQLA